MPSTVTNYQCPACTGPLHFAGESGRLECDYCGSSFDVHEIEALYEDQAAQEAAAREEENAQPWQTEETGEDWGEDGAHMRAYSCPSCGAQILCDETTAATSCPYCGNPTVVPGQFDGSLKPDYVLPFKLSKEDAVAALKRHYKGKLLLPRAFADHNHLEEIQGIYVPFWLFDGEADAEMDFHATRMGPTTRQGDYRVTRTMHYNVHRRGRICFEKVPVDGSSKMPDDLMDSVEPYDYGELKPFSMAYLPGFLADKYDVTAGDASVRADRRCRTTAADEVRRTVLGYSTVTPRSQHIQMERGKAHYALLPVWLLHTKWQDRDYLFAMNGQTGKMVGNLPADKAKLRLWFWGVALGGSILGSLLFAGPLGRLLGGLL